MVVLSQIQKAVTRSDLQHLPYRQNPKPLKKECEAKKAGIKQIVKQSVIGAALGLNFEVFSAGTLWAH
jgi:hypothetical protein